MDSLTPYQLGLYEKALPDLPWPEKLRAAREAGFDYLEISIDETDAKLSRLHWTRAERQALRQAMLDEGCPIRSMCLSGHRKYPLGATDASTRARALEIMHGALELADDLGIRYIQLAGYDVYYEPSTPATLRWFAQNLAHAVELAACRGVVLGFETMETPFMDTVGKAMRYVQEIGSPYLQVYPDVGNLTNAARLYGVPAEDDLRSGAGHLVAAHLKETVPGVYREVPFGSGQVNFAALTRALWRLGVRRFVAEMWYTGAADWAGELKHANAFTRQFLNATQASGG